MTFYLKSYPDALHQLFVSATAEDTNNAFTKAIEKIQKNFQLPGYRKGKVPAEIIIKHNPPELLSLVSEAFTENATEYLQKNGTRIYGRPRFTPLSGLDRDKEFIFSLVYETYPHISSYPDIDNEIFEYEECTVSKEFIEKTICKQAGLIQKTTGVILEDDLITVEIKNPEYTGDKKTAVFDVQKLSILAGHKTGDNIEIPFDQLSGYLPEFLGKLNDPLKADLKEISRVKEWDQVTDTEIGEKSPFKTKNEYFNAAKEQLENIAEQYNNTQKAESLSKKISEKVIINLPKSLWLSNLKELTIKLAEQEVIRKDIPLNSIQQDKEIQQKFQNLPIQAEQGLAFIFWLDEMIIKEKISLNDEELNYYFYRHAQNQNLSVEEFKKKLYSEDKKSIESEALREKTISYLLKKLKFQKSSSIELSEIWKKEKNYR